MALDTNLDSTRFFEDLDTTLMSSEVHYVDDLVKAIDIRNFNYKNTKCFSVLSCSHCNCREYVFSTLLHTAFKLNESF